MKNLLKVLLVFAILSGCTSNDVEKSSANHDKSNPITVVSEVESNRMKLVVDLPLIEE